MRVFASTVRREFLISLRSGSEALMPIVFFVLVATTFFVALGGVPEMRQQGVIPAIWVTTLFAHLLSVEHLFKRDHDEGTLATILLTKLGTLPTVFAKLLMHWLFTGLPIAILAPLIGLSYGLPTESVLILGLTLLISTPTLTLVGAVTTALLVGLGRGGQLLSIMVVPLYLPPLLLGIGACQLSLAALSYISPLLWSVVLAIVALTVIPIMLEPILKASQDS